MTSLLVESAQILQLIENETGQPRNAVELVGCNRDSALKLYKRLQMSRKTGDDRILCELCGTPVYLCSAPDKQHFYFKHFHEDGSCPSVTRGRLSEAQINALRYHGQRESKRHIRLKALLAESIKADPTFSDPVVEGTWKGRRGKEYRRPDVRSRLRDQVDIAFEVQLSTTFGRIMAEREVFYKSEGALLVWIFGEFDVDHARLMMEVIFANNNRNAFIVNEATCDASVKAGVFILECCWTEPLRHDNGIDWITKRRLVRFDELVIDRQYQRIFYVNTDTLLAEIERNIQNDRIAHDFEEFWLSYEAFDGRERPPIPVLDTQWGHLKALFASQGAHLPSRHDNQLKNLLRILYLAKHGQAVGWDYKQFWPAVHRVPDAHKGNLWLFVFALSRYGRLAGIEAADSNRRWAKKIEDWKLATRKDDPAYIEDHALDDVARLAFPELSDFLSPHVLQQSQAPGQAASASGQSQASTMDGSSKHDHEDTSAH